MRKHGNTVLHLIWAILVILHLLLSGCQTDLKVTRSSSGLEISLKPAAPTVDQQK